MTVVSKGRSDRLRGAVALEFLMLFPLVVAMLYAAATYGIVFFAKYKMQGAVSNAVNAALYVDRSAYSSGSESGEVGGEALKRAENILTKAVDELGGSGSCTLPPGDVEMIQCTLTYTKISSLVPIISFGWLGQFPPLPKKLKVTASAAF